MKKYLDAEKYFLHGEWIAKTLTQSNSMAKQKFVTRHKRKNLLDLYAKAGIDPSYDYKALRWEKASADEKPRVGTAHLIRPNSRL